MHYLVQSRQVSVLLHITTKHTTLFKSTLKTNNKTVQRAVQ